MDRRWKTTSLCTPPPMRNPTPQRRSCRRGSERASDWRDHDSQGGWGVPFPVCSGVNEMRGIDVSKATLTCTLLEQASGRPLREKTVDNSEAAVRQLLQRTPTQTPWVLERTGTYS